MPTKCCFFVLQPGNRRLKMIICSLLVSVRKRATRTKQKPLNLKKKTQTGNARNPQTALKDIKV